MQPLPRDFLTQLARKYELSPEQEEAFVELYSRKNQEELEVADALHISHNAFRTRMTGVYSKFSIAGKGPGKFRKLHDFLVQEYQKSHSCPITTTLSDEIDVNALVQQVREKLKPLIQERCGTMRVLDMTQPVGLNDIYTNVNILEKISGRLRRGIDEFLQDCTKEDFDHFGLGKVTEKKVPGLEAVQKHPKLMILGKPGAGKTTFLKYLAIQCIEGKFQAKRVPIFVTLKDFAEAANKPGLLEYMSQQFSNWGVTATQVVDLFKYGRALILLDGLDEVREEDSSTVIYNIRKLSQELFFSEEYKIDCKKYLEGFDQYSKNYIKKYKEEPPGGLLKWIYDRFPDKFYNNYFIATCRIAAREYTFENFVEVEVADFDEQQILNFTTNWFKNKAVKSEFFIKRLEDNNRIKQLATSPLLLTLLCLVFEESGDFPANRSELYKEGLDALLKKWDAKRGIQRDQVYKKLSVQRKEDLLSKIALTTFERGEYFFKQKVAEQYITDYIRNLPGANTEEEALQLDSEEVLRSIEHHHGLVVARAKRIYSFSHLTFHEYFTAREFVVVMQSSEEALQNLVSHITEKRWREVFLLAVGMSPSADRLLQVIKQQVDSLLAMDDKLQQYLMWVNQKSCSVQIPFNKATIRAFYFSFALDSNFPQTITRALEFALFPEVFLPNPELLDLDNDLQVIKRTLKNVLDVDPIIDYVSNHYRALDHILVRDSELEQALQELKRRERLPKLDNSSMTFRSFKQWWEANYQSLREQLRIIIIDYPNLARDWQFSKSQEELLKRYYDANKFLIECLNSDCYISREVRQHIEDTLLLPIADIQKY